MKVAALDLGTNSFLCLLAEGQDGKITKIHDDVTEVVRLGQGVDRYKIFHPYAISRATTCLNEFKKKIDAFNPDRILAVATSAARDVANADELFKIGRDLGIPIEIIEGKKEAEVSFRGALVGFDVNDKKVAVIDVGGGSTEIISGKNDQILSAESLNIGGVRLTEKFISTQPVLDKEAESMLVFLRKQITDFKKRHDLARVDQIYAVAGTPTALAALEAHELEAKDLDGFRFPLEKLQVWQKRFAETTVEEKKEKFKLGGRADIIYAGTTILIEIMKEFGFGHLTVSTKGVRYGVALHLLQNT